MNAQSMRWTAALAMVLGSVVGGCDGILGVEGLRTGCLKDDRQCVGNGVQVCNAFGSWEEALEPCVGKTCVHGTCVGECVRGQIGCDEKRPTTCNALGQWEASAACDYACLEGKCDCAPGQTRCSASNAVETCGADRTWETGVECVDTTCVADSVAVSAACGGECGPGKRCLGNTPQQCNAAGQWVGSTPCDGGQVCDAGNCNCNVGDLRCDFATNAPQICNASNQWEHVGAMCSHQTCDPTTVTCVGVCAPLEMQCEGTTPQSCGANGQWQDEPTCTIACVAGQCTDCTPGEIGCEGNTQRTCSVDGYWEAAACVEATCVEGVCLGECAPGGRCLGNTPQSCNALGQWEGSTPCDPDQVCTDGTCNCTTGDRRCLDNTPQLCDAANQWVDDGLPCTGQTCDLDVAACSGVCGPGQTQCFDANTAQHCGSNGLWQTTATCALGCFAGECAACAPGAKRCTGNTPQTCDANGQWHSEATCVEQTCFGGTCVGACVFGAQRCASNWPQTCNPNGVWQSASQPCAVGESCYQGQCQVSCTPGTKRCLGDYPQTCDGNGQWQGDGAPCGLCIACNQVTGMCEPNPMPVEECNEPVAIAGGYMHTCALFPNGKIKCWGSNAYGQLGLGDTNPRGDQPGEMGANLPFVDLGLDPGVTVAAISAGFHRTCAATSDGRVKCWGDNASGVLGLGDKNHRGDQPGEMGTNLPFVDLGLDPGVLVIEISTESWEHTCAVTSDGHVKCWGDNGGGQLGLGDKNDRGDQPGEMGTNLPFVDLGLSPGLTIAHIDTGFVHTCALTSDAGIKCWGSNTHGQLGFGDTSSRGDQPGEMGTSLPFVDLGLDLGLTVANVSTGNFHNCARISDGRVKCWGDNDEGQLGLGHTNDWGDASGEMGTGLPFVDLGLSMGITVADVSAGGDCTCVRLSDGGVKCWGDNLYGQLGLGDMNDRGDASEEMGTSLPFVDLGHGATATMIRSGNSGHGCAILAGGSVKCWGENFYGQLGLGDTARRGNNPNEMGDNLLTLGL